MVPAGRLIALTPQHEMLAIKQHLAVLTHHALKQQQEDITSLVTTVSRLAVKYSLRYLPRPALLSSDHAVVNTITSNPILTTLDPTTCNTKVTNDYKRYTSAPPKPPWTTQSATQPHPGHRALHIR